MWRARSSLPVPLSVLDASTTRLVVTPMCQIRCATTAHRRTLTHARPTAVAAQQQQQQARSPSDPSNKPQQPRSHQKLHHHPNRRPHQQQRQNATSQPQQPAAVPHNQPPHIVSPPTTATTPQSQPRTPPAATANTTRAAANPASVPAAPITATATTPAPTAKDLSPIWSWGHGHLAGLGHGDYAARTLPTPIASLAGVEIVDVSASWGRNIAITANGSIVHWGWKPVARSWLFVSKWFKRVPWAVTLLQKLGQGRMTMNAADPLLPTRIPGWGAEVGDPELAEGEDEPLRAVACSAGSDWCSVLSSEGQVYTFGAGFYGQLGHSNLIDETRLRLPRMITRYQNQHPNETHGRDMESERWRTPTFPNSPIVQVSNGFSHMLILTKNGQVYACGKTDTGALGITHIYRDGKRLFFPHLIPVTDAYAAGEHGSGEQWIKAAAVESNEAQDTTFLAAQNDPAIVSHYVGPMVQVCAGMKHSLFLNAAGEVYACGSNALNELGTGTYHAIHGLVRVKLPLRPAATTGHKRRRIGAAANAGASSTGAPLPTGGINDGFFSTDAMAAEKIVKIATGNHHCVALSSVGDVYTWGCNTNGQCGVPCTANPISAWLSGLRWPWSPPLTDFEKAERAEAINASSAKWKRAIFSKPLHSAVNPARRVAIESQCIMPQRIDLTKFDFGVPHSMLGRVVDIHAGFWDTVLITDGGYTITFGGGNLRTGQHTPHLFRLDCPTPSDPVQRRAAEAQRQSNSSIATALRQPYRIRKMAFGLGHALTLIDEKKDLNAQR